MNIPVPPGSLAVRVADLCAVYLRSPMSVLADEATGEPVLAFDPPLSGPEQTAYARILRLARSAVTITPAEWASIEDDITGLTTYQTLPSPTLAQTVLAVKAQSRILRALLRD